MNMSHPRRHQATTAGLVATAYAGTVHVCPAEACVAPSAETDRYVLESTGGPIEHVKVACEAGHRFHGAVASLWPGR